MARVAAIRNQIAEISNDESLQNDLKILPSNYNFEVPKTIWKIRATKSRNGNDFSELQKAKMIFSKSLWYLKSGHIKVCLQFPEGLLLYSCIIADILRKYTDCEVIIMGDVTYGACCIGDQAARAFGCDLMVHYGHSCLIPIQETHGIEMLYIFVNIEMNLGHFIDVLKANFEKHKKLALVSTVQFVPCLQSIRKELNAEGYDILIPQVKPLSPGEILGCTSPKLQNDVDTVVYLGDGRFHLESVLIQNPSVAAYQYDPYSKKFTHEEYNFDLMTRKRKEAVEMAQKCHMFGVIQGSLGRQGNPRIVEDLEKRLQAAGKVFVRVLLSEITPQKLSFFADIDCWVQVACPRLSIDWSAAFEKPLLTPYELVATLQHIPFRTDSYPMDYYADESLGPWTNNHETHRCCRSKRKHITVVASQT
uniref:2-(3-amino-3-carboxypropyl)histidine synthase subunit 1 n=1 Tax=Setaria digitata TaxID=48799 RepID=A0A915PKH0_9BILA